MSSEDKAARPDALTHATLREEYERERERLRDLWAEVSTLRGDAYIAAAAAYRREKADVKARYASIRRPGRPPTAAMSPSTRERTVGSLRSASPPAPGGLAREITELFVSGELDLSQRADAPAPGWDGMPELIVARHMRSAGADDAQVRLMLTFTAAMDRARDADRLWFAAGRLFEQSPWAFDPDAVVAGRLTDLADVLRHHGVSQRHGPDAAAWRVIAESLTDDGATPAVQAAIFDGVGDARVLLEALAATSAGGTDRFPLLRGPKVGPMWIRMLAHPGAATITSIDVLPVAVDVQVRKVTEYLGVADSVGLDLETARPVIQQAWAEVVAAGGAVGPPAIDGSAAALDPALWFWGKWGCTRCQRAGRKVPIAPPCDRCRFALGPAELTPSDQTAR